MDPLTSGLLTAGVGGLFGYLGQQQTNQMNQGMMLQAEDYNSSMSNTAYQRAVNDMRNAHLNPMLMFGSGAAASTPQVQAPTMTSPLSSLPGAISHGADTAIAIRGQNKQLESQDAQIGNLQADTSNKHASQALIESQQQSTAQDIRAKAMSNQVLQKTLDAQIKKANAEGNYAELNQLMGIINSGASSASQLVNPVKGIMKGFGK